MALNIDQLMTLQAMAIFYQRKQLTLPPYAGELYLQPKKIATDVLTYLVQSQSAPVLAKASHYDADPTPINRDDFGKVTFGTSFFRTTDMMDESTLEDLNRASFNGDDALVQSLLMGLFDSQTKQLVGMRARREWLAMQALMVGKISLKSNGVLSNVEYLSDPDFTLTPKVSWADAENSTPLDDLQAAIDIMKAKGQVPNQILMNTATFRQIQKNERIKNSFYPTGVDLNKVRLKQNDVVDTIMNELKIVPVIYDQGFIDQEATGSASFTPYVPTGKVVLMNAPIPQGFALTGSGSTGIVQSANVIGHMAFAPTPEELGARNGRITKSSVQIFDTGVAYHRIFNEKKVTYEDLVSMNVLPAFEGSQGVFRMDVNPTATADTGDGDTGDGDTGKVPADAGNSDTEKPAASDDGASK